MHLKKLIEWNSKISFWEKRKLNRELIAFILKIKDEIIFAMNSGEKTAQWGKRKLRQTNVQVL
jgi:hypothetical protein